MSTWQNVVGHERCSHETSLSCKTELFFGVLGIPVHVTRGLGVAGVSSD